MIKRILAIACLAIIIIATFCMGGCNDDNDYISSTTTIEKSETYINNEETDRRIYAQQIKPGGMAEGEKVPLAIYVHGSTGNSETLIKLAQSLARKGVAGLAIECCGGDSSVTAKSDGNDIFPSHYSSRISDLAAAVEYAKTLPYADTGKIYLIGESYGGIVVSFYAGDHSDEIAGVVMLSSGIQLSILGTEGRGGAMDKYIPEDPFEHVAKYTKDVLCFCGSEDIVESTGQAGQLHTYNAREAGKAQIDYYNEHRTQGTATYYELEGAGHGYNLYSIQQQLFVNETIYSMINK